MKTGAAGYAGTKLFEGLYLKAYDDGTGTLTIGWGHTSAAGLPRVYRGMVITQDEAERILASDLAAVENDVNHHVTRAINQNQFDALIMFNFNTGALDRSNVLRDVNAGNFDAVPDDLLMWDHARIGGRLVVVNGLLRRRHYEGELFAKPVDTVINQPVQSIIPPQPSGSFSEFVPDQTKGNG